MNRQLLFTAMLIMASHALSAASIEFTVDSVTFKMIKVEPGTFVMGCDTASYSAAPAHNVTLTKAYYIGQTEVTQALWKTVMGVNPSFYNGVRSNKDYGIDLQRPVESVSWNDCQTFLKKLNELTGENFRLPTEAEWEFAARGGNNSQGYAYAGSNNPDEVCWYYDTAPTHTGGEPGYGPQRVATKAPNELGLYDMNGNVEELCQDWWGTYSAADQTDPIGPSDGYYHVSRGCHWATKAFLLHVSYRYFLVNYPGKDGNTGLRLALTKDDDSSMLGDINLDGVVDVADINVLINIILGKELAQDYGNRAYINEDETIDVSDVNELVNIILGK